MLASRRTFVAGLSGFGLTSTVSSGSSASAARAGATTASSGEPALHCIEPVSSRQVKVKDEFWSPKLTVWQEVTIRDCFRKFENDRGGALNNFDKVRDGRKGGHAGPPWYDGLIYEMIRGSADFLVIHPDPELEAQLDGYIARIAAAAARNPNGYINTYTQLDEPGHDWGLNGGLQIWQHEIYNAGALVDAGIHYYRATGKTVLLTTGVRFANYMTELMGPAPKKNIVPCHSLPEEALVKLYVLFRENPDLKQKLSLDVDEKSYLSLAEFWIENRGHHIGKPDWEKDRSAAEQFVRNQEYGEGRPSWGAYAQDDKPIFEQETLHGHAVRATLLCAGVAAAARVNGRPDYMATVNRFWENMVYRRMHITGGVGAFANEEKFGPDYFLPNDAYLETCAAVGASFFHVNMNLAFGHARYMDELERALYNGALAGVSLKGDTYFYTNPLEAGKDRSRWVWHDCPCCPPMFLKLMGAMPGYIYATDSDSLYVNLFVASEASAVVKETRLTIQQTSRYPWQGAVKMTLNPVRPATFNLMVRIPGWCRNASLTINGQAVSGMEMVRGYARLERLWRPGDVVELIMPMPVEAVKAHPLVEADAGKKALMRGPLVYCLESVDNGLHVRQIGVSSQTRFATRYQPELLRGVTTISGTARLMNAPLWENSLYAPARDLPDSKPVQITAIPYYANANRGPVDMTVWLPEAARPET
ncbi:MAG TPA: beta-L-arabinofuranosidase domain-containing protein [Bryobacteraceae bacterium]